MNENKLIADFMEWDINDPKTFPKPIQQPIYDGCWGDYRFQTSWDWLMPVVQKFSESNKYLDEQDEQDLMQTLLYGYIDDVYRLIVEFIKEYNEYE
jgi:hypothetical protein